jgi:hypothetical protein
LAVLKKKRKKRRQFFSFVNPNTRQWILSPTKEILIPVSGLKIKTIQSNTNTFLISVALLSEHKKSRLCIQGFAQLPEEYGNTFTPTGKFTTLLVILMFEVDKKI